MTLSFFNHRSKATCASHGKLTTPLISQSSSSFMRPFILALATLLLFAISQPTHVSAGLLKVDQTFVNSTGFLFKVAFEGEEGQVLTILMQPEEGNATEETFPTLPSPMEVAVQGLAPNSLYTFKFSMPVTGNTSLGEISLKPIRTHRVGPQIVAFFASDPSPGSGADTLFSVGDQLTIAFDSETNEPGPVGSASEINSIISFSQPIGASYHGEWTDSKTLVITIDDPGQSDPTLGYLTCQVIGNLASPDGLSDISRSNSPPLIGSWQNAEGVLQYFKPTDAANGYSVINEPNFFSYLVSTQVNTEVRLPMSLAFPASAPRTSFIISVSVLYPKDMNQIGFALNGQNFSYAPSANIGTVGRMSNAMLSSIVPTVTLAPKEDYTGYACVQYRLFDMEKGYAVVDSSYINVRIDPPARPYIPSLTANSGGRSSNPIDLAKEHKTPIIIGVSVVVGFFVLLGLSIFAWKRYRGGRDARDFESDSLNPESGEADASSEANAPTRRFYYDAKV